MQEDGCKELLRHTVVVRLVPDAEGPFCCSFEVRLSATCQHFQGGRVPHTCTPRWEHVFTFKQYGVEWWTGSASLRIMP